MHKEKAMKKVSVLGSAAVAGAALVWMAGCASSGDKAPQAMARIISASGTKVQGNALFTQLPAGGVKTEIWIENATPGTHGLHIHEKGDCSAPDATSAGGHFNAAGNPHAAPADKARHNGDLGNIEVGADGKGHLEITSNLLTVSPGPDSVVGRSVIFHEKADDLKTQPTGNAGARYGCGIIVLKGDGSGNASTIKVR
jgi:superoxide dismutase, Cu-Zn family